MSSTKEVKELFTATVHRRLEGIEFRVQSESIEAAMRLLSGGETTTHRASTVNPGWGHHTRYQLTVGANGIPDALTGFTKGRFDLWGCKELIHSRAPAINLSMLLAVGLGAGVTLRVPTVMSNTQLQTYIDGLKAGVRQFYIDYLVERTRTIRITTEEIE